MEAAVHLTEPHHPTPTDVDPGPLADLDDVELAASLVELFFDCATDKLRELNRALFAGDFGRARAVAHLLQGGAAVLGATAVSGLSQAVCEAARAERTAEASEVASRLPAALRSARSGLTRILAAGAR